MNIVHPTDDLLRYRVDSTRPGVPAHLVDLKGWFLNGLCSCEFFEFHCAPHLNKRRLRIPPDKWESLPPIVCKHIKAAQQYAFREILRRLCAGEVLTQSGEERENA